MPVETGEPPQLEEARLGRDPRDGALGAARTKQRVVSLLEAAVDQEPFGADTVHVVERVAHRALADADGATQAADGESLAAASRRRLDSAIDDSRV